MDEVKIWSVDGDSNVEPLARKGQTDTESLLEETLVRNPDLLIPGLRLVGRQTPTEGGPLDLLGIDSAGRLVVFELKRGTLSREAVAQVIDYASYLDGMPIEDLAGYVSERSGVHGIAKIENFEEWYGDNIDAESLDSLRPMRMFLVGLGADDRTERMVRFLAENSDMDISLLTFHGFAYDGKILLARQVEVEAAADTATRRARRYVSMAERREKLDRRIEDCAVRELFDAAIAMFQENWPEFRSGPRRHGLGILLKSHEGTGRRALYARIGALEEGAISLVFFPLAKSLCLDAFKKPLGEIRYETWPRNREPLEDAHTEIQFRLTANEWETHKERLIALAKDVYTAWESCVQ